MDPDMENIPTDYVNGTDFRLLNLKVSMLTIQQVSGQGKKDSPDESELPS